MRRDSNRAVATDGDGHPIRISDTLREVGGEVRKTLQNSYRLPMHYRAEEARDGTSYTPISSSVPT